VFIEGHVVVSLSEVHQETRMSHSQYSGYSSALSALRALQEGYLSPESHMVTRALETSTPSESILSTAECPGAAVSAVSTVSVTFRVS